MKHCVGMYEHKGFSIFFSETYQDWTAEPNFDFFENVENFEAEEMIIDEFKTNEGREYIEPQKTINKAKTAINKFLKNNGKEILLNDYKKFRDSKI